MQTASNTPPRKPRRKARARIGLTPLIDVVFILLVFFMLASSFLDWRGVEIQTPSALGGGASAEGAMLLEVGAQGYRLAGVALDEAALIAKLRETLKRQPGQRFLLRPTPAAATQHVVDALGVLEAAGAVNISLARGG